jgi:hypothetical protein
VSIVNARNAIFGWAVWNIGKRAMKRKAKQKLPGRGGRGRRVASVASGVAAAVGLAWIARKLIGGGDSGSGE